MSEFIVGYTLYGPDNGSNMFNSEGGLKRCPHCGHRIEPFPHNPAYVAPKRSKDLGITYDGQFIVSKTLKEICERERYSAHFLPFSKDPEHFHLIPTQQLEFDAQRRGTRFIELCPECNQYDQVIGATPCYLKIDKPLGAGVFGTDLLFAAGDEQHPLLLVGSSTKALLESENLSGLEFSPCFGF